MSLDESLLQRVLALVAIAQHVPAVGQQWRVMALEDRGKRLLVTGLRAPRERRIVVAQKNSNGLPSPGLRISVEHGSTIPLRRARRQT